LCAREHMMFGFLKMLVKVLVKVGGP
jgi:hypothetical protein